MSLSYNHDWQIPWLATAPQPTPMSKLDWTRPKPLGPTLAKMAEAEREEAEPKMVVEVALEVEVEAAAAARAV